MTYLQAKTHLTGMLHGGTLNKVRNVDYAFERAANVMLQNIDPLETMRDVPLTQAVHDDLNKYTIPSDYKKVLDLYPQDNRTQLDSARRIGAERFALNRVWKNKELSIESNNGSKFININWQSDNSATFHTMDSLTSNGTWSVVGTASGLTTNSLYFLSGSASIEFDVAATGDGIQITDAGQISISDWNGYENVIVPIYLGSDYANLTSVTVIWGNDLTANYITGVAQTQQADGTAFQNGWNYILVPRETATVLGTITATTFDSAKITFTVTGAMTNIRVDNILFSIGRIFNIKYYSKFFFKNSAGTWITRPADDSDTVLTDNDTEQIFMLEALKACAQQMEGESSGFDIQYANRGLNGDPDSPDPIQRVGLYAKYRAEHPGQGKKLVSRWSGGPRFRT